MPAKRKTLYLAIAGLLVSASAQSATPPKKTANSSLEARLNAMQKQLDDWQSYRRNTEQQLADQRQRIQELESRLNVQPSGAVAAAVPAPNVSASPGGPVVTPAPDAIGATVASASPPAPDVTASPGGAEVTPARPAITSTPSSTNPATEARTQAVAQNFDVPGVLTPRGSFVFEPSLQYTYTSSDRVALIGYTIIPAITIGLIDIRQVNRSAFVLGLTGRYGITNRLEIEGRIPYVYQTEDSIQRPLATGSSHDSVFNTTGNGIGDMELALRYQLNQPVDGSPYYIGSLRVKSTTGKGPFDVSYVTDTTKGIDYQTELATGSGFWSYQLGLSAILPSDPAVFFGSVNYTWNQKTSVNQNRCVRYRSDANDTSVCSATYIKDFDPGDVIGFNIGMGIAINDRSSFSLAYDHNVVLKSKVNGQTPEDAYTAQIGMLQLGYAYRLTKATAVNLTLGVGVTRDSPDVQLTLRAPISF
ncbi:hypothetical protein [Microvirgula aerodenitrificans]|uniref:hypothetical protein n=1 Tax=Microvirgula aerodenitrificans TaxID=57480 RepID=UPI0028E58103|nr:hypothetical protein [Microvirgula aerodenitrificans]